MTVAPRPLALTMGDPAGIGPEITVGAWQALRETSREMLRETGPVFAVLADPLLFDAPVALIDRPAEAAGVFRDAIPVLRGVSLPKLPQPGRTETVFASAILGSIERAVRLAQAGEAGGVVTNPISKAVLQDAGFPHPGHTEFLAELTGQTGGEVMMLAGPELRVVPVTVHMSLRAALDRLDAELIVQVGRITADALLRDFGIVAPRIAVAGLNPHAGEQGHMGREEIDYVAPAIAALRAEGIDATGPWPPDTMFTAAARTRYDAALCLYHDQGLIPLKTLDVAGSVNITLGLPIVRTSPDHGTAFDIAGKGIADPSSLIAALRAAGEIAARREGQTAR